MRILGDITMDLGRDAIARRLQTLADMLDLPPGPGPEEALRAVMNARGDLSRFSVAIGLPGDATLADIAEAIGAEYSDEEKASLRDDARSVVLSSAMAIWDKDATLRNEFGGDRAAYRAYLSHHVVVGDAPTESAATRKVSLSDAMDRWDRSPTLRDEFGGDRAAYDAYCRHHAARSV